MYKLKMLLQQDVNSIQLILQQVFLTEFQLHFLFGRKINYQCGLVVIYAEQNNKATVFVLAESLHN